MSRSKDTSHLQIVPQQDQEGRSTQLSLFPLANPRLAVFAPMNAIPGRVFLHNLERLRPTVLLDVRVLPRFDLSGLNRSLAFQVFQEQHLLYRDITGVLEVRSRQDARMNPAILAKELVRFLPDSLSGPVLFLTETMEAADAYSKIVPRQLQNRFANWDVKVGWMQSWAAPG